MGFLTVTFVVILASLTVAHSVSLCCPNREQGREQGVAPPAAALVPFCIFLNICFAWVFS